MRGFVPWRSGLSGAPTIFLTLELGPPVACRELLDDREENARVIAGTERFAGQRHERLDDVFASTVTAA